MQYKFSSKFDERNLMERNESFITTYAMAGCLLQIHGGYEWCLLFPNVDTSCACQVMKSQSKCNTGQ